jgi:GNAT superfamily N-acetyltransferase
MPIDVQMPDGTIISGVPDNITQADLLARYKAFVPPPPEAAGFSAKDTALALSQGVVGAGKSLVDVFGADTAASRSLSDIQKDLSERYSSERQAEMARREAMQKQASKGTIGEEISTFLGGVAEAPVQSLAQGLGSIVPYVGTGIIGGIAKLGGATVKAINTVVGAAQGAGAVKGSIYDGVKQELQKSGMSEQEAAAKAAKAQEYLGENFLDIIGGSALGGVGARVGVENLLTPGAAANLNKQFLARTGKAALAEAPLEGAQGAQEQLAINRALQKQGFDVGTFEGVAGAAARDAAVGAMTGATVGGVRSPSGDMPAPPAAVPPAAVTPAVTPVEARPVTPAESQDTQAMLDEFRNIGMPPAEPVTEPTLAPPVEPAAVEPVAETPTLEQPKMVEDETGEKLSYPMFVDMADKGYKLYSFENPRTYENKGGVRYRTLEKDGVRLAFEPQQVLFTDPKRPNQQPQLGMGNENDVAFHFLGVDPDMRKQGKARQALQDLVEIADKNNYTLYGEPAQLEKGSMTTDQLLNFYKQFGFKPTNDTNKVIVREPGAKVEAAQPKAVKPAFQEKFEQNKAIETELKDLYKERNKLSRVGDNLIPWLKKYGVNPNAKADMGIEKGDRRLPVGIFKKSGYGLDELALAAVNDGLITEQDLARQPDEVEAFRELVYDALQGNVSQTPFNLENMAKLNAIESRIEQLEGFPVEQVSSDFDQEIQAEMDAKAEQAKLTAQPPTGELDEDIPFARSKVGSPEQIDLAEKVANVYRDDGRDSNVVYQNGDIALIQTRKKNGDVIYMPIKGQRHSTNYVDVSTDKGSQLMTALNLTQAQKDDLVKAREEIELSEKEKHEKTPFLVIKPGVTGSPGMPKEFVNVARGFVKMLGITGNIYITSKTEAAANKDNFTGPHRPIGYMGDKVEFGSVRKLDDDNFVMLVNPGTSKVRTIETIAHELGHIHEIQVFDNAGPEVQKAIIKDFNKWFDSQKNMSAKELVDTLRPKVTAQQTEIVNPMARATDLDAYWRNFPEWYADQVSRWATTSDKPLTVVDKFFKKLADALKKFYKTLKGQKYLPTQSMKEFLDNIAAQSQFESIKETFDKGQMALFSKSKVEPTEKTRLPEKMSFGIGGLQNLTPINKPSLWHETSGYNAADLIREDARETRITNEFFLADNPDIALGQRGNTGVLIEYDGYNVSGKENRKPMTGDLAGREYVANAIARNSIKSIKINKGIQIPLNALIKRDLKNNFDRTVNEDGSITYTRKEELDSGDITESKGKVEATTTDTEKPTAQARNYLGKQIQANWAFPEDNIKHWPGISDQSINDFLYKIQDKQIDTKNAQQAIEKAAGEIEENINVYEKEQLYHGRTATGIRKFLLDELMPAIKELGVLKLTPQDLKDYLYNRHAEERNNKMNEVNKLDPITGKERKSPWELQDRASGISTKDARAYLANLEPAKKAALEKVAKRFDEMVQGTQQILLASGAEDKATIDAYNNTYKHYVPLFRIENDFTNAGGMGATGASKGFGVRGAFSKRAMGSEKEVQDILGNLIAQRERALIRAEKSRVGQALYGLALTNPNPDLWLPVNPDAIKSRDALVEELQSLGYKDAAQIADNLMEEPKSRYISKEKKQFVDPDTGLPMQVTEESVKLKLDNLKRFGDNVFPVRINGKDRYIFFNKNDPRALRMVHSLMNLDADSLGDIEGIIAKATRWFASVNTQYNPIFGVVNLIRDIGGSTLNLSTTAIAGDQAKVNKNVIPAMRGILNVLRDERKGKTDTTGKWAKAFQDFREQGGQTGYRDSLIRTDEEKQIIEREINKMKSGNTKKAFYAVVGALSDFNDMMENSIRLSAYMAALDKGLSKQKAAILAKNLTVNFDKKGQLSARINAYFAFFNASVQGTARLAKTLKGPKGKAIIGGGIALGAAQAVILALAGFDEDEPPEFVRERNFVIPLPDGKFLTIPYPLGFNVLPNVGRLTTEFVLSGGKDPGKKVTALLGSVVEAFSPIGGSELSLQTISPTVVDPLVAIATNKDAFGRPIYKKDQATNPTPGYLRSRENASEFSKNIAYFLNLASGGTKYSKGYVSPTGDEIDYLIGQITGGVGRELIKTEQTVKAGITGEELPAYRIPLVGRFYGETQSNAAESQRFYNNIIKMADHENEVKGRIKNKEPVAEYLRDNPQARLWKTANNVENQINALNKQKKEFIEKGLPKDRIKRIENQKAAIMKRFNDQLAQYEE